MIPQRKLQNKMITKLQNKRPVIEFELFGYEYEIEVKRTHYNQLIKEGKVTP